MLAETKVVLPLFKDITGKLAAKWPSILGYTKNRCCWFYVEKTKLTATMHTLSEFEEVVAGLLALPIRPMKRSKFFLALEV